jgi:hypothetical protein
MLVAAGRWWQWSIHTNARIKSLEEQAREARRMDHTVSTNAALEDALAVVMRIVVEEQMQADYRTAWITKLQAILQTARKGPHAYPVDQPSGNDVKHRRITYSESSTYHSPGEKQQSDCNASGR